MFMLSVARLTHREHRGPFSHAPPAKMSPMQLMAHHRRRGKHEGPSNAANNATRVVYRSLQTMWKSDVHMRAPDEGIVGDLKQAD